MRVVHVSALLDPARRSPPALLTAWRTLPDVAAAVVRAGMDVTCVIAAHEHMRMERDGVHFEFVNMTRRSPRVLAATVARHAPDVVHLNGLAFPALLTTLRTALPHTPLLVQDHADRPPGLLRGARWRPALKLADGIAFTAADQAGPFLRAGVIGADMTVFSVPESSSHFLPGDGAAAGARLGVVGDPCIAWVGRLDANKDPVTVLRAMPRVLSALPGARLWLAHGAAPLLAAVQAWLAGQPALAPHVRLLGTLPHADIELLLRRADIFVSASHREGSGYALLEALACGCTPVVSDIPPFRALRGDGGIGELFPTGDHEALADVLVRVAKGIRDAGRDANAGSAAARVQVRSYFDRELSFDALGLRLRAVYEDLHARRNSTSRGEPTFTHGARTPVRGRAPRGRALRVALVVPGGVDRSGVRRVIPRVLWLTEQLAHSVELHVIALRQEEHACSYPLLGATVHCLPAHASRARTLRRLLALQRELRPDVWHALWLHPQGTLAGAVGALTRRPVLLHLTGGDLTALPEIGFGALLNRRGRFWLRAATRAASTITVSSSALQQAAARLGLRTQVVSPGVDLVRWPPRPPQPRGQDGTARLLHAGTINRVKDHTTLLHALAALRERGVAWEADLIGEDILGGVTQALAARLGLEAQVRFHGWQPHHVTRQYMEQADVLLVSSRFESGPFVLHEAAAAGVPTVGTAVGDLLDWAPDAAVVVPVADAAALADAVALLLTDETRRLAIAQAAHARSLRVDARTSAAQFVQLYEQLATAGR